jgi:hypothetical protein
MSISHAYHPYRDASYAEAFAEFGDPLQVVPWGTFVLRRAIGEGASADACGLYPLLALMPDADISAGRRVLEAAGLVTFVGVTDPFAAPQPAVLAREFDICYPFKQHAIIDRQIGKPDFSRHHRQKIRRALRSCLVERLSLRDHVDRWMELYDELAERQGISGIQRFSRRYFERLAEMPCLGCFAARQDGVIVAMTLWLRSDQVAYFHLGASSALGYDVSASYALIAAAIEEYGDCDILNLGGVAGLADDNDGLSRFKRGFANSSAYAHLCGMILNRQAYDIMAAGYNEGQYFPIYRSPDSGKSV